MKMVRIILWSVVAVLLLGILVVGIRGELPGLFPKINFNIPFINLGSSFSFANSELYTVGAGNAQTLEVSEIELHWVAGEVNVVEYSGSTISFSEASNYELSEDEQMRYYLNNGKLMIQFCAPGRLNLFGNSRGKTLTVYVPGDFEMDNLVVDAVSASVNAEGLDAVEATVNSVSGAVNANKISSRNLSFESVSGRLSIDDCSADRLTLESVSGAVEARGEFGRVSCTSVSGSVSVAPGAGVSELDIETVSGKATVVLPEIQGFTANYESVSGRFNCDFAVLTSKGSATYGNGSARLGLNTVSGSINIEKE